MTEQVLVFFREGGQSVGSAVIEVRCRPKVYLYTRAMRRGAATASAVLQGPVGSSAAIILIHYGLANVFVDGFPQFCRRSRGAPNTTILSNLPRATARPSLAGDERSEASCYGAEFQASTPTSSPFACVLRLRLE